MIIKLTAAFGMRRTIHVNAQHIIYWVRENGDDSTVVVLRGDRQLYVKEQPDELVRMIHAVLRS